MRAVGYSLETAIADIVDNSIAAGATSIAINFSMDVATPYLTILDNGSGMSPEEARNAMRLAGVAASASRAPADLGRFGLAG
jgi:DNA mismatch repair ATPase MutL